MMDPRQIFRGGEGCKPGALPLTYDRQDAHPRDQITLQDKQSMGLD
jgi:hypothetical protein